MKDLRNLQVSQLLEELKRLKDLISQEGINAKAKVRDELENLIKRLDSENLGREGEKDV